MEVFREVMERAVAENCIMEGGRKREGEYLTSVVCNDTLGFWEVTEGQVT